MAASLIAPPSEMPVRLDVDEQRLLASDQASLRALKLAFTFVIVAQRLALPVGKGISIAILAFPAVLVVLSREKALRLDRGRTLAYFAAMTACAASTWVSILRGLTFSTTSFLLLLLLYIPFCFAVRPSLRSHYRELLDHVARVMTFFAVVAIAQFLLQSVGVPYSDPFTSIPSKFLVQGFNTLAPVRYASPVLRSNGVVFLEPSFLSQGLALGLAVSLLRSHSWKRIVLYGIGILTSVSGTGVILFIAIIVALARLRGSRWLARILIPIVLLVAAVQVTPAGSIFSERATEGKQQNSSFTQRFTAPYQRAAMLIRAHDITFYFGEGPGAAEVDATEIVERTGLPLAYGPPPKVAIEYGLIAAIVLTLSIAYMLVARTPSSVISSGIVVFYFVLSGSLLQPHTVAICWLLTSLFAHPKAALRQPLRTRLSRFVSEPLDVDA